MSAYLVCKLPHIYFPPWCSVHRTAQAGFTQTHAQQPLMHECKNKDRARALVYSYRSWTIFFILSFMSFFIKDRSCTSCLNSDSSTVQIADACGTKCIKKTTEKENEKEKRQRWSQPEICRKVTLCTGDDGAGSRSEFSPPFTFRALLVMRTCNIRTPSRSVSRLVQYW